MVQRAGQYGQGTRKTSDDKLESRRSILPGLRVAWTRRMTETWEAQPLAGLEQGIVRHWRKESHT